MSATSPDLEEATAEDVVAYGVEHYAPRLTMACSFQKEESVLLHMLRKVVGPEGAIRAFTIDTGVLFPETIETQQRFEDFYGMGFAVMDARSPGEPWTASNCCGAAKVAALEAGLSDVDAWITGIRREQAPTRAAAPKLEQDAKRGIWKLNPLADWTEKDIWRYIFAHDLPYHPLHDQGIASIGCAPCTQPGSGREGRWTGQDKTECGIHVV
jgi:phosphoadenosine phosphosulfate reductase